MSGSPLDITASIADATGAAGAAPATKATRAAAVASDAQPGGGTLATSAAGRGKGQLCSTDGTSGNSS